MVYFKGILVQNRSKIAKIAPEGGENFWGRIFFVPWKTNKKTLGVIMGKAGDLSRLWKCATLRINTSAKRFIVDISTIEISEILIFYNRVFRFYNRALFVRYYSGTLLQNCPFWVRKMIDQTQFKSAKTSQTRRFYNS